MEVVPGRFDIAEGWNLIPDGIYFLRAGGTFSERGVPPSRRKPIPKMLLFDVFVLTLFGFWETRDLLNRIREVQLYIFEGVPKPKNQLN